MAKVKTHFVCQSCGYQAPKFLGRCPNCGSWDSMVEEREEAPGAVSAQRGSARVAAGKAVPLSKVDVNDREDRILSGIGELDRVLGGGIVRGSIVLVGGDPGIGKSTLLMQLCGALDGREKVLYVSGEESPRQLKLRAERLKVVGDTTLLMPETVLEDVLSVVQSEKPGVLIVDSIQTMEMEELESAPGSVTQLRECTAKLMHLAKDTGTTVFVIGHVTKQGSIAGPKILEHIVDTVLYFEGDRFSSCRILRTVKNRFGAAGEIGVFEMKEEGLAEVKNPSALFLEERPDRAVGSVAGVIMEGSRPILVEVQALITPSTLTSPRRVYTGLDYNRMSLILAVLEKKGGLPLSHQDVFLNVVGGLRAEEPALDLAVAAAVISASREVEMDRGMVAVGEVGLTGETRAVRYMEQRLKEAEKLGFKWVFHAKGNKKNLSSDQAELFSIASIGDLLNLIGR